jgi:hypothetical protein
VNKNTKKREIIKYLNKVEQSKGDRMKLENERKTIEKN